MGNHATRSVCASAHDAAAAKGTAARLSTYAGVPLDALVAYERAALRLSHNLDSLRRSAATATKSAAERLAASTSAGGGGPATASKLPRRPLLQVCAEVQKKLRQDWDQKKTRSNTAKDKAAVAEGSAYQDGVPLLLQELAWEWRRSASRERGGRASRAGRPTPLRAEEMTTWNTRTAQLLRDYVRSWRYEKALRQARKAAAAGAEGCTSATAVSRKDGASSGGAPRPRVFRELFKSYEALGRLLTRSRSGGGGGTARSSFDRSTSHVTSSMWCAVLCQFVRALPEPLIPSLCSRRLEPLAGAPSRRPSAAVAPVPAARAAYAAMCRLIEESFIPANVVAYTTFCYVLDLVQKHRAELTGDEVETVAQAVVRESSLYQVKREVAHACKPEIHMFWPPRRSAGASPTAASAAASAPAGKLRRDGRGRSSSSSGTLTANGSASAAVAVKSRAAVKATAQGSMTAVQRGGGMTPSSDGDTSSYLSSDASSAERGEAGGRAIGEESDSEEIVVGGGAADAQGRLAGAMAAAHTSVAVPIKTLPGSTAHAAAGGGMWQPATSSSSVTTSEEGTSESGRYPPAVAARAISAAARPAEDVPDAPSALQKDSWRTSAAAESRPQVERKQRCVTSNAAHFSMNVPPVRESSNSLASEHRRGIGHHSVQRIVPLTEDDDMRLLSMPACRQELTALDVSKLNSALYPSELEDPAAVEAEAEALRYALQRVREPSPAATTSSQRHDGNDDSPHPRSPEGKSGSPQGAVVGSSSASAAPVPPQLSSSHRITPTSTPLPRDECHPMPRCSRTATATPALARPPTSPSSYLKPSPSVQGSAAGLPVAAYRAQAEQPLLTALMVAKQRFLAALTTVPKGENPVALSPPRGGECAGWFAASSVGRSGGVADHRLERVVACAREMGWTSVESLIESLTAAAASITETGSPSTPRAPELKPEAPHHARRRAAAYASVSGLTTPFDTVLGLDCSVTEDRSRCGRECQQPHAPRQGADSHLSVPSPRTEAADSALPIGRMHAFCGSGVARTHPQGVALASSPKAGNGPVAGTGHAQLGARLQHHKGHMSPSLTTPLEKTTSLTIPTTGAAVAEPFSGLDGELKKLRSLVCTLETRQSAQACQSSAQMSELSARCAELQHQQLEQGKQLRLACARLLDVRDMLEELRSVKTHLQGQLMAAQQGGARLRDALLLGERSR
ncbi:hypothetical protein LSCM1_05287 [Leishmania martiniquensis]|uniref:Uncharacterized protein n=1 Tax=Leishmania martiniquensis TaxID=1580590 RepID=A0A836GN96_9TRYP|nr:hypothetical protein LSCM1_05287 [Leishmania martiniquensis]